MAYDFAQEFLYCVVFFFLTGILCSNGFVLGWLLILGGLQINHHLQTLTLLKFHCHMPLQEHNVISFFTRIVNKLSFSPLFSDIVSFYLPCVNCCCLDAPVQWHLSSLDHMFLSPPSNGVVNNFVSLCCL